ncbi:MAG TPA: hypothetical protein VLK33_21470 [Terriglobales bacterium]|nr:hypothetical protein [Terriglobales bacterium]
MRKLALCLCLLALSVTWLSCGGYKSSGGGSNPSKVKFRAVVSNSLHPVNGAVHVPALEIIDATTDQLSFSPIGLTELPDLGELNVASNKTLTLAYSPSGHLFGIVNNSTEQSAGSTVTIPGSTDSFFLANNVQFVYAAVPNAPVPSGIPGAVVQVSLSTGAISATIPVPNVRYIREIPAANTILSITDNSAGTCSPESGAVVLISEGNIGSAMDPRIQTICGFDHPIAVGQTDDLLKPVILQCGKECGSTNEASVVRLDLSKIPATVSAPITVKGGATAAISVGNILYVAGTAPGTVCSSGTAATSCGTLTAVDLNSSQATKSVEIPDGYHDKMEVTTDGQIAVGSHDCTEINTASEVRGCLAFFNPSTSKVSIALLNGNVTGLAAIPGRNVLYAIQGGEFVVYDTTTDKFLPNHQTKIVGELIDVKVIDKAP